MTPDNREPGRMSRRKFLIGAGATVVALGGGVAAAKALGIGTSPEQSQTQASQAPATSTPKLETATASSTATPTKPPETSLTPEPSKNPETVPLLRILPLEFYSQARRTMLDVNGVKVEYLVFNLPPGTPITAPVDGLLVKAQESGNLSGFLGQVRTNSGGAAFRGDIKFDDMLQKNVKTGDVIGHIGNTGVKIGDTSFNMAFTLIKVTDSGSIVDEGILKQSFPKAFEEPLVSVNQNPPGQPTVIQLFGSNPPTNKP